MSEHKKNEVKYMTPFKQKAIRATNLMQKIHYVGIALIVVGILFLRFRFFPMVSLIALGCLILFISLGWAMLSWDCPTCGKNLRAIRSILEDSKYCPFCGNKI